MGEQASTRVHGDAMVYVHARAYMLVQRCGGWAREQARICTQTRRSACVYVPWVVVRRWGALVVRGGGERSGGEAAPVWVVTRR